MPAYANTYFYNQFGNIWCDQSTEEEEEGSQRQVDFRITVSSTGVSEQRKDKLNELTWISSSSLRTA